MTHRGLLLLGSGLVLFAAIPWIDRPRPRPAATAAPTASEQPAPTQRARVVVGLSRFDLVASARLAEAARARVLRTLPALGGIVLEAPGAPLDVVARLRTLPGVAWAELDRSARAAAGPGRCTCSPSKTAPPAPLERFDLGRVARALRLRQAWAEAPQRGKGVVVGLVDTGVDRASPALRGALEPGINLVAAGAPIDDAHGHGTAMAGAIAGRGDGKRHGFLGVAPQARILPIKASGARGRAPLSRVARGIVAAADRGAQVIYVGFGARGSSPTLAAAVRYARRNGSLVVAPAGNDGLDTLRSPALERGALAVGGLSRKGDLALTTNLSSALRLVAPAESVPAPHGRHARLTDGTSPAAALTAGVAALALARCPTLTPDALERVVLAGSRRLARLRQSGLDERLDVRSLDALGPVLRARTDQAEVAIERVEVTPNPPALNEPAKVRVTLLNQGQVALRNLQVRGSVERALPASRVSRLAPGARRTVTLAWTPRTRTVTLRVRAQGVATGAGPALPCVASTTARVRPTRRPRPNFAVTNIRLVQPMTLARPSVTFEVTFTNRGAATGKGALQTAVDGRAHTTREVVLAPGERRAIKVRWAAPGGRALSRPILLEARARAKRDPIRTDDLDTFQVAVQDPSLPLDPLYRQDADIDFAVDAPWRVASDRPYVPLMVFVPSIGRPSRYATFHETLSMRRGIVRSTRDRGRSTRESTASRFKRGAGRVAGDLFTYTTAMFIKELGSAARGDEQAIRRFFDRVMTSDFAIDYSLYAVGAAGGRKGFELVAGRAKTIKGLRWTGTNLGSAIARSQAALAAGYLLPNLIRGRIDRRVAIDLAALGLTTAGVETLAHGIGSTVARTSLGARAAAFMKRYGKVSRAGGWAVEVGKLVLILYASEWIANNVDDWLIEREARKALRKSYDALTKAAAGSSDATWEQALRDLEDAFDAYRNVVARDLEGELTQLNRDLVSVTKKLFQAELGRKQAEANARSSAAMTKAVARVYAKMKAKHTIELRQALQRFEGKFAKVLGSVYDEQASATLSTPGTSKPALFDLELKLLEGLAGKVSGERLALLNKKRNALARLKKLDLEIARGLIGTAGTGAPVANEVVVGTDGMRILRAAVDVLDSWHFPTDEAAKVAAQKNKYALEGAVTSRPLYRHDVARGAHWVAAGVKRLDEMGQPQQSPVLFDAPRPIVMKGRYNILKLPLAQLKPLAKAGTIYLRIGMRWELTKVVRGKVVRPAEGAYTQTLRVHLGAKGLPSIKGIQGGYLDAHFHTIAEWYNPEPGFVADLELDAPRKNYGGPIPMLLECAYAMGAIDAPSYAAARNRLVTTDHNSFYVQGDDLANRPPFGPTAARGNPGKSEFEAMRKLLGESVGEEIAYQKKGLGSVGVHMLDYRSRHIFGTWNAQVPIHRTARRWIKKLEMPTLDRVLSSFAKGEQGNQHAFAYASHPVSGIPWEDAKLEQALDDYWRAGDQSFPFKGMQVWNMRPARAHSLRKLHKYLNDLNPFVSKTWQGGQAFDGELNEALGKYRRLLRAFADYRHPADTKVRMIRKHYVLAGSDAHGDFNYTVGGLATILTAMLGRKHSEWLKGKVDKALELSDSAFMRARTFVATEGYEGPAFMNAMAHGSSVITDGPLVWFELDGDGRFDAARGVFDAKAAAFKDRQGKIGGSGAFDGGRTVLLANEARPVFRYAYTNHDEFGRPTGHDALARPTGYDGSIAHIRILKTDLGGQGLNDTGSLAPRGGRAFGKAHTESLNTREEGPVKDVSAIQLAAFTSSVEGTSPADVYRAITNPVWAVKVTVQAHLDPAKFDAQRQVIRPGGLRVELRSPISLAEDKLQVELKALDAQGKSGKTIARLKADGWANGADGKGPYKGGLFRVSNSAPIALGSLPRFGPGTQVTFVAVYSAPRDHFGNALNAVAATFQVDALSGKPGKHADAKTKLTRVRFADHRGIVGAMTKR